MANAQYAILRFAKYKGPEISGIEAHNERTKEKYASNPDIDPSRTHLNFHLIKPERKYRAESEKQIAESGCRTRSDSVRVVEALITATPEFFKGKKRAEIREFFNEALEFIKQNQAPETIISAVVPVGINTSDSNFNTVEKTGGASAVTLTTSQMPSHTHTFTGSSTTTNSAGGHTHNIGRDTDGGAGSSRYTVHSAGTSGAQATSPTSSAGAHTHSLTPKGKNANTGGGGSHTNLQPYIVCYMWKRTA